MQALGAESLQTGKLQSPFARWCAKQGFDTPKPGIRVRCFQNSSFDPPTAGVQAPPMTEVT